jgi:hypothetical protein
MTTLGTGFAAAHTSILPFRKLASARCMAVVTGRSYQLKRRSFICWELFF